MSPDRPVVEAAVDVDGDGRDELVLPGSGNTHRYRLVFRLAGCDIAPLLDSEGMAGISYDFGGVFAPGGVGFSCADRDGDGRRDPVADEWSPVVVREGRERRVEDWRELEAAEADGSIRWRWPAGTSRSTDIGWRPCGPRPAWRGPERARVRLVSGWDCGFRDDDG